MDWLKRVGTAGGACCGILVAQVVLPAAVDLMLSMALIGIAGWAGHSLARFPG